MYPVSKLSRWWWSSLKSRGQYVTPILWMVMITIVIQMTLWGSFITVQGFPSWCYSQVSSCGVCYLVWLFGWCWSPEKSKWMYGVIYHVVQSRVTLLCALVRWVVVVAVVGDPNPFCVTPLSGPHAVSHCVLQVVNNVATPEDAFDVIALKICPPLSRHDICQIFHTNIYTNI